MRFMKPHLKKRFSLLLAPLVQPREKMVLALPRELFPQLADHPLPPDLREQLLAPCFRRRRAQLDVQVEEAFWGRQLDAAGGHVDDRDDFFDEGDPGVEDFAAICTKGAGKVEGLCRIWRAKLRKTPGGVHLDAVRGHVDNRAISSTKGSLNVAKLVESAKRHVMSFWRGPAECGEKPCQRPGQSLRRKGIQE